MSGCEAEPSEAPLFEKYVADSTNYPVKAVFENDAADTYYIASTDKWYVSRTAEGETAETLHHNGAVYDFMHEEKTAFVSPEAEENSALIGYIPANPEKWVLTEKGEAQYEGKTYLYETATMNNDYFLTLYADPETKKIEYVSNGQGNNMTKLTEITHSFDLRIFEIPEDYDIVNMP